MHRIGIPTTTTTAIRPPESASWPTTKEPALKEPVKKTKQEIKKQQSHDKEHHDTVQNPRTGGFFDKKTILEQEMRRYHPSGWLLVRLGSLAAFPYLTCAIGAKIWPQVVQLAASLELETTTIAFPVIALRSMSACFTHNALYGLLYHLDVKSFDTYRVDEKPWHWEMDPDGWKKMLHKTIGLVLFNFLGVTFPLMYINRVVFGTPLRLDTTSLPNGLELFWQLMFCLVIEDFGFHHTHQLLHTKRFYWIHKVHHQYHSPIGISAAYAHPIEYLFGNILPSVAGPMMLRHKMHAWSFCIWLIFRASAAVENHSGYEFPWSMYQAIPFKAPTEYHDFHHNRNQGTYSGVLRFWDWVYGTNTHYLEWVRMGRPETRRKTKKAIE